MKLTGPLLTTNKKIKYYLESQLRFIDNHYVFSQALFYSGVGYKFSKKLTVWLGTLAGDNKSLPGVYTNEVRVWQQVDWRIVDNSFFNIETRSRLEERRNFPFRVWELRLREKDILTIPIKNWENHSFCAFNELFFNFNHPNWASNQLIEQNRVLLGLDTKLSKEWAFIVGYLNQYQFPAPDQPALESHVIYLSWEGKFD